MPLRDRALPIVRKIIGNAILLVLGGAIALNTHPMLPSNSYFVDTSTRSAKNSTSSNSGKNRKEISAATAVTAECRATLQKCRREGLQPKRHRRRRLQVKIQKTQGLLLTAAGKDASLQKRVGAGPVIMTPPAGTVYIRPDCRHRGPYGRGMIPCYTTPALEREIKRHDRWIVDSLAYLSAFDGGSISAYNGDGDETKPKPITLIIFTVNRHVPYLAVLVASLLRGHNAKFISENVDIHIVNIDMRPCRCAYSLLAELEARLPFVTFHDRTDSLVTEWIIHQRRAFVYALELCKDKRSDWCFIFEDDAVATANLIPKFFKLVESQGQGFRSDLAIVSMYYPHNEVWTTNGKQLYKPEYASSDQYQLDSNASEYIDAKTGNVEYRLNLNNVPHGLVANAYPLEVLGGMVEYLQKAENANSTYPTDRQIMKHFVLDNGLKKWRVEPSLANHLGHYSENRRSSNSGVFYWMSTDVRFQLEDGWSAYDGGLDNAAINDVRGHFFN